MSDGKENRRPGRRAASGLGDTVAAAIHALTGIKPCAACKRRRQWLNRKFPYKKKGAPAK